MNCETAKNLIQPYLEGRLAVLERNEFVRHVTECAACEREVIAYREVFRALREIPRADAPPRLSVAVMARLHADGLVHEPRFSPVRRVIDGFMDLPAKVRYPIAALAVIAVLYAPVGLLLGRAGRSLAGLAESFARSVVWARGLVAEFPGVNAFDTYIRAARTILHAAGALVSPGYVVLMVAVIGAVLYSMARILRRKRHSGHAVFSF
jgi:anti-sigma factor RsiW